jgi:hypothetical protein
MDWIGLGSAAADVGGFALFLAVVIVVAAGLWRKWWVPGWLYQQEVDARKIAETQATRNAEALELLAKVVSGDSHVPPRRSR